MWSNFSFPVECDQIFLFAVELFRIFFFFNIFLPSNAVKWRKIFSFLGVECDRIFFYAVGSCQMPSKFFCLWIFFQFILLSYVIKYFFAIECGKISLFLPFLFFLPTNAVECLQIFYFFFPVKCDQFFFCCRKPSNANNFFSRRIEYFRILNVTFFFCSQMRSNFAFSLFFFFLPMNAFFFFLLPKVIKFFFFCCHRKPSNAKKNIFFLSGFFLPLNAVHFF